ncbi:serine/threonine-protein phosphatase [Streptomyces actuosus]|uniref:Serine/threonine-protein phosphatase n=1 Tax=Streptomyces actuosus TaxID=1885 RepID=A0ABS2VZ15_STRAS|nr:PP2C family protein-serine/threonine phosphatase [Streptomyces actuosus]MBN0048376.1 serine/threonine-protein phosphatase [Streptomyces actuosus]
MGARGVSKGRLSEQRTGRGLLVIALALIVVITVADIGIGTSVHLGPLLVIAPALTASFAGPRLTALVGALAQAALLFISIFHGGLTTTNHVAQLIALAVLSALVVFICYVRERHASQLNRVRSVAETAQRTLLRPPPRRVGPLRVAWLYLAAEDEAQIGGDLLAVARTDHACTRVLIGDVRGHGLASIGEASVVMGAFREGAPRYDSLPELVTAVEESVCRNLEDGADTAHDAGEHFITAVMLDIHDQGLQAEMLNCGHPPPLLIRGGQVTVLNSLRPAPPLGLCGLWVRNDRSDHFTLEAGDMLLLYTDGVIEARSPTGAFYPLVERLAAFPASSPDALLHHIHRDLLEHTSEQLSDDAAFLVIERTAPRHLRRPSPISQPANLPRLHPADRHRLAR